MTSAHETEFRLADGSIHFDRYRERSRDLRAAVMRAALAPAQRLGSLSLFGTTLTLRREDDAEGSVSG